MAMLVIVRVKNDSRKYFFTENMFYIHMTSGAETADLTLTGTGGGGGRGNSHPISFSEMAAESALRIRLKICITNGASFAKLLAKKN